MSDSRPINLHEHRSRRVRAGMAAPDFTFGGPVAKRRATPDEVTESQQARLRAAERLAYRSPVRPSFVWGFGLAVFVGLFAFFHH